MLPTIRRLGNLIVEAEHGGPMRLPEEPPTFLRLFTPQFDMASVLPGLALLVQPPEMGNIGS